MAWIAWTCGEDDFFAIEFNIRIKKRPSKEGLFFVDGRFVNRPYESPLQFGCETCEPGRIHEVIVIGGVSVRPSGGGVLPHDDLGAGDAFGDEHVRDRGGTINAQL